MQNRGRADSLACDHSVRQLSCRLPEFHANGEQLARNSRDPRAKSFPLCGKEVDAAEMVRVGCLALELRARIINRLTLAIQGQTGRRKKNQSSGQIAIGSARQQRDTRPVC